MSDNQTVAQQSADVQKNVLINSYVSFLNHDFRGSLGSMPIMIEVLRRQFADKPDFAETLSDLELLKRSIADSLGILDRFVVAYRLENGTYSVRQVSVSVQQIIDDVLPTNNILATERDVKIATTIVASMTVNTDRELLKLILNGLLSNAILHGSRRGGQIKLTIAKSDVSQSGLIIMVSDSGPGIPAANLPTIFDGVAGVRGKNKMKMGLHICKMAADILGAKLEIQPNTPSGIVAKLSIP